MIRRLSTESSVTIPFERTFRRVGQEYQPKDGQGLAVFQFCGCGWPHHLLIPKGSAAGMPFDFFVMISDYSGDAVDQSNNRYCIKFNKFFFQNLYIIKIIIIINCKQKNYLFIL